MPRRLSSSEHCAEVAAKLERRLDTGARGAWRARREAAGAAARAWRRRAP